MSQRFWLTPCGLLMLAVSGCTTTTHTTPASSPIAEQVVQKPKYETYVKVGQTLPVTQFQTIDGKTIDFIQSKNRKLVILFATWCSDSQRAMKALHESSILQQENLEIVAIARENTPEEIEQFKLERDIVIDLVADIDRSIYQQFASAGIPRFIMVDENNRIVGEALAEGENQLDLIQWH